MQKVIIVRDFQSSSMTHIEKLLRPSIQRTFDYFTYSFSISVMSNLSASTVILNSALLYEIGRTTSTSLTEKVAAISDANASYYLEVSDQLLRDKYSLAGVNNVAARTHHELDYYRWDIHHGRVSSEGFIRMNNGLWERPSIMVVEKWYATHKQYIRHVPDIYHPECKYIFAVGSGLYRCDDRDSVRCDLLGRTPSNICTIDSMSDGKICLLTEDGSIYFFDGVVLTKKHDAVPEELSMRSSTTYQLPSVFVPLREQ